MSSGFRRDNVHFIFSKNSRYTNNTWITARTKLFIIKYPFDLTYNIHVGLYLNINFFFIKRDSTRFTTVHL